MANISQERINTRKEPTQETSRSLLTYLRGSRLAVWATIGAASFASTASAVAIKARSAGNNPNPNNILSYPCYAGRPTYNTKFCGQTRNQLEAFCASIVTTVSQANLQTKLQLVDGSSDKYKVSFDAPTAGGCWPGGKEVIKVSSELNTGEASSTFSPAGSPTYIPTYRIEKLAHPVHVSTVIEIPHSCTNTPDIEAKPEVTVGWVPKPGWSTDPTTNTVVAGAAVELCA